MTALVSEPLFFLKDAPCTAGGVIILKVKI